MGYSIPAARRLLLRQLLALPIAGALIWLLPYQNIALNFNRWYLLPAWIAASHPLTAAAYVITARRLKPAWILLTGSILVYGSMASATHAAAAMLIALAEETIFRLALLSWLADALGGAWSVLLTSALFSALHTRLRFKLKSLPSYFDYFLFSIVLGIITLYTESLLPAFVLHTMRNYILRCMLISRAEYDALHRSER